MGGTARVEAHAYDSWVFVGTAIDDVQEHFSCFPSSSGANSSEFPTDRGRKAYSVDERLPRLRVALWYMRPRTSHQSSVVSDLHGGRNDVCTSCEKRSYTLRSL